MSENNFKVDISSTALEKGIDLAKNFLEKLITPTVEETGLFFKEQITSWRFKNQIKILNKARNICIENNIHPKAISLKLLCPLLENASLEDDEFLQNKWAILLTNMVDSEQNIENHVFPFLLSQISKPEFLILEKTVFLRSERRLRLEQELNLFLETKDEKKKNLELEIKNLANKTDDYKELRKFWKLQKELKDLDERETNIQIELFKPEYINENDLEEFEMANLIRLGLVKNLPQHYVYTNGAEIRNDPNSDYLTLDNLEINIENDGEFYFITELGDLFMDACKKKTIIDL
ncbi:MULTISPECIES: Abi-alpha family protein [unclassified Chryseobacterium]|uniref:Abi-alpha family protein n=1 Tax=unclassified Chryseobacterium TaxID=2593645 RepID=UPI001627E8A7|nr:Abi-alpha family protein [Chryseobacterium sp. C3]